VTNLDALAQLVAYPDEHTRDVARATLQALDVSAPGAATSMCDFLDATAELTLPELQEHYTAAFDFDPACVLDVGWHLFGESPDRGAFLAALRGDLRDAGIAESPELPDHLTHVLALISRHDPGRAESLAALVMPALTGIEQALTARRSPYAHVLAAVHVSLAAPAEGTIALR
jgi:nitrate reductase delta subunit